MRLRRPPLISQELIDTRKRLKDDFRFYAKHALKIRTKAGKIAPLILNNAQNILAQAIDDQMASKGYVRIIILKARQQGLSTAVEGWLYSRVSQEEARKALVVAHKADSTQALFDMTKRYHANMPDILKPSTKYSSKRELSFDTLDSMYTVATAGGDDIARGETIQYLHCSELGFWPKTAAADNWNGLRQAVPDEAGTAIFIESTANGVSGLFYDLWQGAVSGENEYIPVFIPWFLDTGYRLDPPAEFEKTPEELKLIERFNLEDGQLWWRRKRIAENGRELFQQEYPATPDEAFLTSGRPVFNSEQLHERMHVVSPPLYCMAIEGDTFTKHPRGELLVFKELDPKQTYYVGADVGAGVRGGDWSVAQVLDSDKVQVAKFRAQVHPDYYATILYRLGTYYNLAHLAVENNNHGLLTCHILAKDLNYPNFYQEIQHDKITDKETIKLGFTTNVKTKPMIIDELRAEVRDATLVLNDKGTINEMLTYVMTESGKMEAEAGRHDDCVMALAIANHVHEGKFTPILNLDEYYVEMI